MGTKHVLHVLRTQRFRGRVSQKSVLHWCLRCWDGMKTPALGSSTGAMSFASKEPTERKLDSFHAEHQKDGDIWSLQLRAELKQAI